MARQRTRKADSAAVQGEGSYVMLVLPSRGEVRRVQQGAVGLVVEAEALQKRQEEARGDQAATTKVMAEFAKLRERNQRVTDELVCRHVKAWNWQGDDGERLHPPSKPADLEALTEEEAAWLEAQVMALFQPRQAQEKN